MKKSASSVAFWCLMAALVCGVMKGTNAVVCDVRELIPCTPAIAGDGKPSAECCVKLRQQVPCLCTYIKDPLLAPYVSSPNSPKVAAACHVAIPKC